MARLTHHVVLAAPPQSITKSLSMEAEGRKHAEGKPIPTELRRDEQGLRKKIELEDDNTAVPRDHIDDEYARAEERDPKILITTSRDPSSRLVQFAKEMKLVIPNAQRINRGGQVNFAGLRPMALQKISS